MNIITYDIDYNQETGYYNIVDSNGKQYGEYLTFEDADDALNSNNFENDINRNVKAEVPEEYVVCREYTSHGQHYVMFTRGNITDHVSYPESSVSRHSGFNDKSIKIYSSRQQAIDVAKKYNEISRKKKYYHYANWKALMKWW